MTKLSCDQVMTTYDLGWFTTRPLQWSCQRRWGRECRPTGETACSCVTRAGARSTIRPSPRGFAALDAAPRRHGSPIGRVTGDRAQKPVPGPDHLARARCRRAVTSQRRSAPRSRSTGGELRAARAQRFARRDGPARDGARGSRVLLGRRCAGNDHVHRLLPRRPTNSKFSSSASRWPDSASDVVRIAFASSSSLNMRGSVTE